MSHRRPQRDDAIAKEVAVFTRAASGAPVRPRTIISRTLKYFGRTVQPCNLRTNKHSNLRTNKQSNLRTNKHKSPRPLILLLSLAFISLYQLQHCCSCDCSHEVNYILLQNLNLSICSSLLCISNGLLLSVITLSRLNKLVVSR